MRMSARLYQLFESLQRTILLENRAESGGSRRFHVERGFNREPRNVR